MYRDMNEKKAKKEKMYAMIIILGVSVFLLSWQIVVSKGMQHYYEEKWNAQNPCTYKKDSRSIHLQWDRKSNQGTLTKEVLENSIPHPLNSVKRN